MSMNLMRRMRRIHLIVQKFENLVDGTESILKKDLISHIVIAT